jgi:hypothetical protein
MSSSASTRRTKMRNGTFETKSRLLGVVQSLKIQHALGFYRCVMSIFLLWCTLVFVGCEPGRQPPPRPAGTGPGRALPLPTDPQLRRLAQLGARVKENAPRAGLDPPRTDIEFRSIAVTAEMLALARGGPLPAHVMIRDGTIKPGALAELDGATSIGFLGISGTDLNDEMLSELNSLPGLVGFSLKKAQRVRGVGFAFLSNCPELKAVTCTDAPIENDALAHLADHPKLKGLHLTGTRITDDGLCNLTQLPLLSWLELRNCGITGEGLKDLAQLTALTHLDLEGTSIKDESLASLSKLGELKVLELNDTSVTDAGLAHLVGCTKLATLNLDGTQVSDYGMSQLARLPALGSLTICRTSVTDAGIAKLSASKSIGSIEAFGTGVTKAARKLLPRAYLRFDGSHDASNNLIP